MRFGLVLPSLSGDAGRVLSLARRAEELGFDGIFVPDHLGGTGRMPLEAGTTLAAVASATSRIAVGSLVMRSTLRPVGMLAKLAASLQDISGGRLILGLGAGDDASAREQKALGLSSLATAERRQHLLETVSALRALLSGEPWSGGEQVPPIAGPILPEPDRLPQIWVGGASDAVADIAARNADAWNGWGMSVERFAATAARVTGAGAAVTWGGIVAVSRTESELADLLESRRAASLPEPHWAGTPDAFVAWVEGLSAIDVRWVTMVVAGGGPAIEMLAGEVMPGVLGER